MRTIRRIRLALALAAAVAAVAAGARWWSSTAATPADDPTLVLAATAPETVAGYDRSCARGHGCVFGPAWSDDVDVEGGHNGCDTRNDILRRDLTTTQTKPGTRGCVVVSGVLTDPYTSAQVQFAKQNAAAVNIDHIWPLAAAWSRGAATWSLARRTVFANDPVNLLATSSSVNQSKSDKLPDQWSPSTPSGKCTYATRFLQVARAYQLVVTTAEYRAITRDLTSCGQESS